MRRLILVAAGALVLAPAASAGGWATAGLAPPESGIGVGETWNAETTILQHGRTPLVGVQPAVIIVRGSDGKQFRFPARPTDRPGVYNAKVKFPSEGTWTYRVDDGFSQMHDFAPIQIGAAQGGDGGFSLPAWAWGIALAACGLLALYALARRLRPAAAPVGQP